MYKCIKFHYDQIITIVATVSCAGWQKHSLTEAKTATHVSLLIHKKSHVYFRSLKLGDIIVDILMYKCIKFHYDQIITIGSETDCTVEFG